MSEKHLSSAEKMSARAETIRDEVRLYIATAAGDRHWDDTRQSWLSRAARRLGLPYSRVKNLWYRGGRPYADELDEMRARITGQAWAQRRAEERQHDVANQIQALVSRTSTAVEHGAPEGERAGSTASSAASIATDAAVRATRS